MKQSTSQTRKSAKGRSSAHGVSVDHHIAAIQLEHENDRTQEPYGPTMTTRKE